MKVFYSVIILLCMLMSSVKSYAGDKDQKILVVYYSWSEGKNTETLAKFFQEKTGADIFEIEAVKPYPSDYNKCVEVAKADIQAGLKPAIKGKVQNLDQYDVIFVGTPNWWSTMAPPVLTFLSDNDFTGKTIVPFCTHGGGGEARCFVDMQKAQPNAKFLKGLTVRGHKPQADIDESIRKSNGVNNWLKEIGVLD